MAYYPNFDCANFCYWMLNLSWQRLTGPQTVLITTVYNASLAQTSVSDQQWKDFTMVSSWRSKYYESWGKYASYYNSNCQTWLNNLPSTPPTWYSSIVNQLFQDLEDAGIFNLLDRLFIFSAPSEGIALISLVNPTATPAGNVNSTTFTPYQGYTGNGTTMYLNSQFNPTLNGVNYTQNSASAGVYVRKERATANQECEIGHSDGSTNLIVQLNFTGNIYRCFINSNSQNTSVPYTTTKGLFSVDRTASNLSNNWRNGVNVMASPTVSNAVLNVNVSILARGAVNLSTNQVSMAYFGSGGISQNVFYNIIQTFMTRVGCQV